METTITNNEFKFEELSISDKLVSLFTEPSKLFSNMSKFGVKTSDWIIPVIVMTLLAMTVQIVIMQNPALKQQVINEQMERFELQLNQMVESGQFTQAQADEQLEIIYDKIGTQMDSALPISLFAIGAASFIFFFIISGIYILTMKYLPKSNGSYKEGLSAYGLPHYIMALQLIVTIILIIVNNDVKAGPDAAKILGYDTKEFTGYILSYIDPLKIWFYVVVGVAFAKLFKSKNSAKYIITSLSIWVIFGLSFFGLAQIFPLFQLMIR